MMAEHFETHDADPGATTERSDAAAAHRDLRLGAVGIALTHFTEPLMAYSRRHLTDVHAATTVLTKQLESALTTDHPTGRIEQLLLEPARIALPGGTTAASLLDAAWGDFERDVAARVAATHAYVRAEGLASLLRLSAWYGMTDRTPWWGTPAWDECTSRLADRPDARPALVTVLRTRPEIVDHMTLCRVLSSGHGHRAADQLRTSTAA
jgi:hypothetical protein